MRAFIAIFFLCFSLSSFADQQPLHLLQCAKQVPFGFHIVKKNNISNICRKGYFVSYDNQAKIPVYVSYVLTPEEAVGCLTRTNSFAADQSLPSNYAASIKDYAKSGYDKGHMANDSDMRWDAQAEEDSFILSNMAPQLPSFNRGIWKKLEDLTRAWAIDRNHNILVHVGPIYSSTDKTIGNDVVVPHAFFKILIDMDTKEMQVFLFKHGASTADLSTFLTDLSTIQASTNIIFAIPNGIKNSGFWNIQSKSNRKEKDRVCSIK